MSAFRACRERTAKDISGPSRPECSLIGTIPSTPNWKYWLIQMKPGLTVPLVSPANGPRAESETRIQPAATIPPGITRAIPERRCPLELVEGRRDGSGGYCFSEEPYHVALNFNAA